MTLVLTGTASSAVCQVTDRLVTRKITGEGFDALANKNVVFLARDGLVTLGYTGLAYLEGEPTDRWFARKLALDESLQDDGSGALRTGFGLPERWMDVGQAMMHLAAELTKLWLREGHLKGSETLAPRTVASIP